MPQMQLSNDAALYYRDDDFSPPWMQAEAVLMMHGCAENGLVWNGWVEDLGAHFRLLRPDMRGFGRSTPAPPDYPWSLDGIVDDYVALMDRLEIERVHLVGAKIAGAVALRFAVRRPERVHTLTVVAARIKGDEAHAGSAASLEKIESEGVGAWARATNARRLGSTASPAMQDGWIELMGTTSTSSALGFLRRVKTIDASTDLPNVACPALVIATPGTGIDSVEAVRSWQSLIPKSELAVLSCDSYHVAATHPRECARTMRDFIERSRTGVPL